MTAAADRTFLTDARPYLNARQAAIYVGFEPGPRGTAVETDPQMKSFFSWASRHGVGIEPGRAVYRRAALDAAVAGTPATTPATAAIQQQARDDVAAARRRFATRRAQETT